MTLTNKKSLQLLSGNPIALSTAHSILASTYGSPEKSRMKSNPDIQANTNYYHQKLVSNHDEKHKTDLSSANNCVSSMSFSNVSILFLLRTCIIVYLSTGRKNF